MKNPVPKLHFDSNDLDPKDREDSYRHNMGVIFDVEDIEDKKFEAKVDSYLLSDLVLTDCQTVGQRFLRPNQKIAKDSMDHIMVQLFVRGSSISNNTIYDHSKLLVIDSSRPWDAYNPDFRNITLVVPRRLLKSKVWDEDSHHGRAIDLVKNPFANILRNHMLTLHQNIEKIEEDSVHSIVSPTVDLLVGTLNYEEKTIGRKGIEVQNDSFLMQGLKNFVEENIFNLELGPELIQKKFSLTRPTLYRLFVNYGGVVNYIRERRLKAALKSLLLPEKSQLSIAELAFSLGFEDHSSFSRAFKSYFGFSPRDARRGEVVFDRKTQNEWHTWLFNL